MNLPDFRRLIAPLGRKIFLLLGRAILKAIDNSQGTQKIQIIALADEIISDMERFQEYGFETYPFVDSEVLAVFLNGNRDHGIALCIHDRRYRPTDLVEGEIVLYTDEDKVTPFRVHLKRNRILSRRNDKEEVSSDTSHYIDSPQVMLGGNTWAALRALVDSRFITLFNAHVHSGVQAGGGNTGAPTVAASEADQATGRVRGI